MGTIRLLLAISVVLAHTSSLFGFKFVGDRIAVELFYMISGFYMALILNEKYISQTNSYKLFITNRLLKLYPVYWFILAVMVGMSLVGIIYTGGDNFFFLKYIQGSFEDMSILTFIYTVFSNIFMFLLDAGMFLGFDPHSGALYFTENFRLEEIPFNNFMLVPQAWTIGLELLFYLIAPFIVRRKVKYIAILAFISIGIKIALATNGLNYDPWTYRFFPSELHLFLFGAIAYKLYTYYRTRLFSNSLLIGILLINIAVIITYSYLPGESIKMYIYMVLFFASIPFIFILCKKWKWDSKIGDLSYPIYISHIFVLSVVERLNIPIVGSVGFTVSVLSILFSIGLNYFITDKVDKYRQKRVTKPIALN